MSLSAPLNRPQASIAGHKPPQRFKIVCLFAALLLSPGIALADDGVKLYVVEEDWELVVSQPHPGINAPQVAFFTYPDAEDPGCYFQLQMNYAADEYFSGGGFHVAAARDEQLLDEARSETGNVLSLDNDTIRWTSVMAAFDGELLFAVKDGYGEDWGAFGGPEYLVRMPANGVDDLIGYSPTKSAKMIDVQFGKNRVASIILKEVRLFFTDGTVTTVPVHSGL